MKNALAVLALLWLLFGHANANAQTASLEFSSPAAIGSKLSVRVETIAPQPRVLESIEILAGELTEAVF